MTVVMCLITTIKWELVVLISDKTMRI